MPLDCAGDRPVRQTRPAGSAFPGTVNGVTRSDPARSPGLFDPDRLRTIGDPVLRTPAAAVGKPDEKLARLTERMISVCRRAGGVGLAAPQIGVSRSVFVAELAAQDGATRTVVALDPVLTRLGAPSVWGDEGCLSIPGRGFRVARHDQVLLEYTDLAGVRRTETLRGWDARVVQHECDHLAGVLIADVGEEQ